MLQRVMARLKAMRLVWPSAASLDGGHHRSMMPRPAAVSAVRRPGDGAPRRPLGVARVGRDAVEEHAGLELPALEVGAQDGQAVLDGDLGRRAELAAPPEDQHQVPAGVADVAHPLRLAPGGDEVLLPLVGEQVDRGVVQLARGAAPVLEHPGAP